jgi:hypothetical protein
MIFLVQQVEEELVMRTKLKQVLIAISGSFDVIVKWCDTRKITLNKPNVGLLINTNIWRN